MADLPRVGVTEQGPPQGPGDPRDPRDLATDAGLLAAWLRGTAAARDGSLVPFTIPGHKQRTDLVGAVVDGDLPLYAGLDDMAQSNGHLARAEAAAARLWSADWCRFSVGGATHANQALALALGRPGAEVVVARSVHRSVLLALVLAGLRPVWVRPGLDAATGLPTAVPVAAVERALADHPAVRGVILGDPSYVGTFGDLAGQARAAHAAGVPLVVDAAWAAHLGFHPDLPRHALAAGADAMVVSAHKALPAMNQAALLLARTTASGGLLDADRLERAFDAGHTTSPSGRILASTDAARARDRERLREVPGLDVLAGPLADGSGVDPAKLVLLPAGTGAHGGRIGADLAARGLPVELADRDVVIPMVTVADDAATVAHLVDALVAAVDRHRGTPREATPSPAWTVEAEPVLPPREAFFAAHVTVPAHRAVGRVCAELVAPYPPGVPVLAPGERVTAEALAALRAVRDDGGRIAYAADPTLATLQVVR